MGEQEKIEKITEENAKKSTEKVEEIPKYNRSIRRKMAKAIHHNAYTKRYVNPRLRHYALEQLKTSNEGENNDITNIVKR